jgi:hydrogenase maturation protease
VIGIGNPDRGDDGVGVSVARLLRNRLPDDVRIEERSGHAADLIDLLHGTDWAILVDAMVSGQPPGSVAQIDDVGNEALPSEAATSSHGLGVAAAVGLARALGVMPRRCTIFAVEGGSFDIGLGLSPAVAQAAHDVAATIAGMFKPSAVAEA